MPYVGEVALIASSTFPWVRVGPGKVRVPGPVAPAAKPLPPALADGLDGREHGHADLRGHSRRQGGLPAGEVAGTATTEYAITWGGLRVAPAALGPLPLSLPPTVRTGRASARP